MLGSRKLLIFGIVSVLVLALLTVCAFAAVPEDVKALSGGDCLKSPAPDSVQVPNSPFKISYNWRSVSNGDRGYMFADTFTSDNPLYLHFIYYKPAYPSYGSTINSTFDDDVPVYFVRLDSSGQPAYKVVVNGTEYSFTRGDTSVAIVFSSFSELPTITSAWDIRSYQTGGYLNPLPILGSILGIGSTLVAFVIARPIVLIPIVAMILVLSYGVIRRLIKGV